MKSATITIQQAENQENGIFKATQIAIGEPIAGAAEKEVAVVLAETIIDLSNNDSRMQYPAYYQARLPMTSCLIELQSKEDELPRQGGR